MYFPYGDETKELNDEARKNAGGSWIQLSDGMTQFFLFLCITLYAFGHLLLERKANESSMSHVILKEGEHL